VTARDQLLAIARSPGWQLVIGGALLALVFPSRLPGSVGLAIVAGGLGVAVARWWPRLPASVRAPREAIREALVIALVAAAGLVTFHAALATSPDWPIGDWGPQHAVLARVIDHLPGLDVPAWNHAVGTGDAPLELYPKLAYLVVGHIALATGLTDDLPHAMLIVAVLVHVAIAVATALLAARLAPRPIALGVGLVALVDTGAVAHGGTVGLFRWGLLHSALALLFATVAALGVIAALRRPRLAASITIWLATALACATHPAGLIAAAAAVVGLAAVALLATDVPPRRAVIAIGHVALGVALGAVAWQPLAERLLAYGQHFPNAVRSPSQLLEDLLAAPSPVTAFALLAYAGYLGIVAGLWSRRAVVVFPCAVALVLLVGLCDAPYLALDLAPGQAVAHLGTERLAQLARPFLAAAGAYAIWLVIAHGIASWRGASARRRTIAAATIGILACALVRELPAVWRSAASRAAAQTRLSAGDPVGREQLVAWARDRVAELGPHAFGRALFEVDTHEHFHLTALTGLPTLHASWQPDLLLRERIEDLTPASLERFAIRWVIGVGRSPVLGDPASELELGSFRIRELPAWDGRFARIERGEGEVIVTRLDDEAVEVDVRAAAPVLVALGTGYYPRWRAEHAGGAALPVYAYPATPSARLSVVAAWLPPGRSRFTVDGPLPSDGKGTPLAVLALAIALGVVVTWSRRRWRVRVLRRVAALRARVPARLDRLAAIAVPVALGLLVIRGCAERGPIAALELGTGARASASVEARVIGGAWQRCDYRRVEGTHVCPGLVTAYDGIASLLNDAPPSWAFNTAGIHAVAEVADVELRARFDEHLAGTYWIATAGSKATLAVEGELAQTIDRATITYADRGARAIELRAHVPIDGWTFTFVREDTMMPARDHLVRPPEVPPVEIRAFR
jgi:hypothetical protein